MQKEFVLVYCDVNCTWDGNDARYRLYVNDELFTERTWIWTEHYLEERLPIQAPPGQYSIRYELVGSGKLTINNFRIIKGPAIIDQQGNITIQESQHENA